MKSQKDVWIISHDSVLDHRLFFFERYFSELGFNPIFIAGNFVFEGYGAFEKGNVIRPESKQVLYDFSKELDIDSLSKLQKGEIYCCLKVINALANLFLKSQSPSRSEIVQIFKKFYGENDYAFAFEGEKIYFRVRALTGGFDLDFDSDIGVIRIIERKYSSLPPVFKNFDFTVNDFVENIYNFSSIFERVDMELDSGQLQPPALIYAADLPTLPIGIEYKKRFNVPLIVDCHEWWKEQYLIWGDGLKSREELYDHYEKLLYKEADLLLTVGKELSNYMSDYFGLQFNHLYTCDSIGFEKKKSKAEFWSKEIDGYKGEKILLFQGSITPQRNIESMVEIASHLSEDVLLVVAGAGSFTKEFLRLVNKFHAGKRVKYLGWQNQERLLEFTNYADVGFIPYVAKSRYYSCGAPNKLFEFLSAELPIVYHKSMLEIDNIVGKNSFGIAVDYEDPKKAAREISQYILNQNALDSARKFYREKGGSYFYNGQKEVFKNLLNDRINCNLN